MGKPSPSASSSSSTPSSPSSSSSSSADRARRDAGGGRRRRRSVPRDSPFQRSSTFRGVTRHRWTGRFEAHLWDKHCWNDTQTKKGKQVYLGAYDEEEAAAHAYDLAALKYWGPHTPLNFPVSNYQEELKEMSCLSREEYIGSLRRKSSGFSRGVSKYRGVARHHHNGRWEARIGRVFGNKYLYLGTYATQEEAATAYDMAAIEHRGLNAVTNFDLSRYAQFLKAGDGNGIGAHSGQPQPEGVSPNFAGDSGEPPAAGPVESAAVGSGFPSASPESDARPSCFPDDIQVYFEADTCGGVDDDAIFGELDSFLLSTFDFEDPVLA